MKNLKEKILQFLREEEGLTTVEYAVAGSLVAGTLIIAFTNLGDGVRGAINDLTDAVGGDSAATPG